ncbi:MAG: hypothetical protein ACI38O_04290 [Fibrobacter intestinalis]|uniref:hypothetical protein n=1 Tax=Fibrobacter intestinalis TaxID=28122 RepID=UPI003F0DBE60
MNMKFCISALSFLFFCTCSSEVEVNYKLSQSVPVDLYVESTYSTMDLGGIERVGTIVADYVRLDYSQVGDTLVIRRQFEVDKSRGYLKNSHPAELQWRLPEVITKGLAERTVEVKGFAEEYDSLLYRIPMPQRWRDQLLNPDYVKHLERQERHRYEMDHLLVGKVPEKGNITSLLKERGRLQFALIQIDSVVTDGFHNLDRRKCLGYTVYLKEKENFPYYIWEQHVNSKIGTERFQAYHKGLSAEYETAYWVTLDPETGIPCQEREVKQGIHTMVNPKTGDTATFKSNTTLERLYTVLDSADRQ